MTTRVQHDISRLAALEHQVVNPGTFTGADEYGRAVAQVGVGNAAVRLAAASLGAWGNGVSLRIGPLGSGNTSAEVDTQSRIVQVRPALGATAVQVATAINAALRDPRGFPTTTQAANATQKYRTNPFFELYADTAGAPGGDPATPGVAALAGGAAPSRPGPGWCTYAGTTSCGLFVFDAEEPVQLVQFAARLDVGVPWGLYLRPLSRARAVEGAGILVASGTGASVFTTAGCIVPVGWGLGFEAPTTGRAHALVRRAGSGL